jgi:general L-amino acid transport system permease protein
LLQALILLTLVGLIFLMMDQAFVNLKARGIQSGWDFLLEPAGFDIGESPWLDFSSDQSYYMAFAVGLCNTIKVSVLGIFLSSIWGLTLGLAASSPLWSLRFFSRTYVELVRNIPLLIQLLACYVMWVQFMPPSEQPLLVGKHILISQEGLAYPGFYWLIPSEGDFWTGHWCLSVPRSTPNGIESFYMASPEFLALLLSLTLYTSAFIAEIVRAGIASISSNQIAAATSLGLHSKDIYRHIILPQATKLIWPPLTNQYLNLLKNSSLAVAIGFPDLVSIGNTALNQTGRALECIGIMMLMYLLLSLLISLLMAHIHPQRQLISLTS